MKEIIIVNDYGHGGSDPGAVSGVHIEKKYNTDSGRACTKELERHGITVIETRKNDETLSLSQRCDIANKYNTSYVISHHHNAGGGNRGETIHSIYGGKGEELANAVSSELKKIGQSTVKVYDKANNSGKDYYALIRGTKAPCIIVEYAFLDNKEDVTFVDTLKERERNGIAVAHAVLKELDIEIKKEEEQEFKEGKIEDIKLKIDGKMYDIKGMVIDESTYIKVRDLQKAGYTIGYVNHVPSISKSNPILK